MSSEANKTTIRKWVEEGWNRGDFLNIDTMYAADYLFNDPSSPGLPRGSQAIIAVVNIYRTAFPDLRMDIEELVAEGDKVAWRWTVRGTHTGPLMSIPPTGKAVTIAGIVVSRFAKGKWVEDYVNWDTLGMMQQIGVIPAMA